MITIYKLLIKVIITILNKMPCSFCGQHGHTINNCVSPAIEILYNRLKDIYIETNGMYNNIINVNDRFDFNRNLCERRFKNEVDRRFGLRELRVVAVRYTVARASINKRELLHYMWTHFNYGTHEQSRISNNIPMVPFFIHTVSNTIPFIPDNIPEFAQDLDSNYISNELIPVVPFESYWTIDRTPDLDYLLSIPIPQGYMDEFITTPRNNIIKRKINVLIDLTEDINTNLTKDINTDLTEETENIECPICYEPILKNNEIKLNCCHEFCCSCISKSLNAYDKQICALCRTPTTTYNVKTTEMYNVIAEYNVI
jgi:hypothetical protein